MGRIVKPSFLLFLACAALFYLPLSLRIIGDPVWPFANATCGLLTVWVVYLFGKNWRNERTGLFAGGMLATAWGFFGFTQIVSLDMVLTFWTTLTLYAGSRCATQRSVGTARWLTYLTAIAVVGGIVTKGWMALLPLMALIAVFYNKRRRGAPGKLPWQGAALFAAALLAVWFFSGIRLPILTETADVWPLLSVVPAVLLGFAPWSIVLPKVVHTWCAHRYAAMQRDSEGALLIVWMVLGFIASFLAPSHFYSSLLPLFPALALLVAYEFDGALESNENGLMPGWLGVAVCALSCLLFIALLLLKWPYPVFSHPGWAAFVAQSGLLGLILGLSVSVLVGVWGMRQTLVCVAGIMLVQVLLLTHIVTLR